MRHRHGHLTGASPSLGKVGTRELTLYAMKLLQDMEATNDTHGYSKAGLPVLTLLGSSSVCKESSR
jgi:hypothetical protein